MLTIQVCIHCPLTTPVGQPHTFMRTPCGSDQPRRTQRCCHFCQLQFFWKRVTSVHSFTEDRDEERCNSSLVWNQSRLRELTMVRAVKWVLMPTLTVALAAYGLDCLGMATPEQAMQCCNTMRCHTHSHHQHHGSQDCCNTTPQMHAALGQPSSVQALAFSPVALGVVRASNDSQIMEFSARIMGGHSHDPPPQCSTAVLSLRI
jgi:hypothetical protein